MSASQMRLNSASAVPSETAHDQNELRQQLRDQLLALPAPAFAQLVARLLCVSGYIDAHIIQCGGQRLAARSNRSKCGGIDLKASTQTDLARSLTVVQMKQYRRPVPRRFVDELRGAMLRDGACQGLVITTSIFSSAARRAASTDHILPVRLMNGEELLDLLFLHQLGVQAVRFDEWSLDRPFFARLEADGSRNRQAPPRRHARRTVEAPREQANLIPNEDDMMWQTHALAGLNTLWLWQMFPNLVDPSLIAPVAIAATFGALLPDLDASESKLKHVQVAGIKPFVPLANVLHRSFGHRGLLHSLWGLAGAAALASPLLLWEWTRPAFAALLLGYFSHLAADACTKSGIPLLYLRKRRYHLLPPSARITTGSLAEDLLFPFLAVSLLVLLFRFLPFTASSSGF